MPVQFAVTNRELAKKGLTNYWGYDTLCFFAPEPAYTAGDKPGADVTEFKQMVKALHKANIEVIIDVVYNHSGEGNEFGPALSFRGIDNASYYRLDEKNKRRYKDFTGTGNSLNTRKPEVLKMIMDSLRYWVTEMHVDGFRFDLAPVLVRELDEVNRLSSFFSIIYQDPVLSQVKLIAEPWDLGKDGYQVGKFPLLWAEWNGKFRDNMRKFWRRNDGLEDFAKRFSGSPDLYRQNGRFPSASINFITAHDGFTLEDLVSYNTKHNEENGSENEDGAEDNHSCNWGVEGQTENADIKRKRRLHKRNLLVTLLLSQGVPMLLAGDETGNTQLGNNNAYCQDNEISWINWAMADKEFLEFTRMVINLRRKHPVFSRHHWFTHSPGQDSGRKDLAWFSHQGKQLAQEEWNRNKSGCLGMFLDGKGLKEKDQDGKEIIDDNFYIAFNNTEEKEQLQLPSHEFGQRWITVFDTSKEKPFARQGKKYAAGEEVSLEPFCIVLFKNAD